jgi:hypothetical protein
MSFIKALLKETRMQPYSKDGAIQGTTALLIGKRDTVVESPRQKKTRSQDQI